MFLAIPQRSNGIYQFSMGNISRFSAVPFFCTLVAPDKPNPNLIPKRSPNLALIQTLT